MAEEESIKKTARRVLALEREDVTHLGVISSGISGFWQDISLGTVVPTGERKRHILDGHPEMRNHIEELIVTVRQPDEIHRNKRDRFIAIFWRRLEQQESYLRVAVLLSTNGVLEHSVMSAWRVRRKDFEREARHGRLVWKQVEGA